MLAAMRTTNGLMLLVVGLSLAGCATGVENEPPSGTILEEGGVSDPGDGGTAADGAPSGDAGDAGLGGCPSGMVKAPAGGDTYCIDATEVTNAAYSKFLAANPSVESQPDECKWNDDFKPASFPVAAGEEGHPVVEVDWCDAHAYCAWAGKRLCGRIGGGSLAFSAFDDPKKSQWFNACSQGGARQYPYVGTFDENACNGSGHNANEPVAVMSMPTCEGGMGGVFDMSGNVLEWEDACDGATGRNDLCRLRGGSYQGDKTTLQCAYPEQSARGKGYPTVGFRCCRG